MKSKILLYVSLLLLGWGSFGIGWYNATESSSPKPETTFKLPADAKGVMSISKDRNGDWVVCYWTDHSGNYKVIQYGPGNQTFIFDFVK